MSIIRDFAVSVHKLHEQVHTLWRVREKRMDFRSPLTYSERKFFLSLFPVLREANTVLYDIGASIGTVSCCVAKLLNVSAVHAFEPIPSVFNALQNHAAARPIITCHNVALGDENGTTTINIDKSLDSSSLLQMRQLHEQEFPGSGTTHQEEIQIARLDDYVLAHNLPTPTVIKIDVQGYEDRVLRGGEDTIRQCQFCVLEINLRHLYETSPSFDDIYQMMRTLGFRFIGVANVLHGSSGIQASIDGMFENELFL